MNLSLGVGEVVAQLWVVAGDELALSRVSRTMTGRKDQIPPPLQAHLDSEHRVDHVEEISAAALAGLVHRRRRRCQRRLLDCPSLGTRLQCG